MPLRGQTTVWPFSEMEERGSSLDRERLLRELINGASVFASSSQIRPSSESSLLQGTTSTATEQLLTMERLREVTRRIEENIASRTPSTPNDAMLNAYRHIFMYGTPTFNNRDFGVVAMDTSYSPSIASMITMEAGRIDGQVRIIETPKGNKMNELMIALEAMMRRIVQEELKDSSRDDNFSTGNFRALLKDYADNNKPEFAAIVSQGALDMPWFDDAIEAEVENVLSKVALPVTQGVVFEDKTAFNKAVRDFVLIDASVEDWVNDSIVERVRDMDFSISVDR